MLYLNYVIVVRRLPVLVVETSSTLVLEPCTFCALNNLAPCSIGIEPYTTFETKFVQRNKKANIYMCVCVCVCVCVGVLDMKIRVGASANTYKIFTR